MGNTVKMSVTKKLSNVLAVFALLLLLWILVKSFYVNPYKLETEETAFTIATIKSFEMPSDGGMTVDFIYNVNGKEYKGFFSYSKLKVKVKDRYYLKYLKSDPRVSVFLFSMQVPDYITNVPKNGWQQIP